MKTVFLENLPKKTYKGRECIDWLESKGYRIHFINEDIEGELFIKDTQKYKNCVKLLLVYKGKEKWYSSGHVKKCGIGNLIGTYNYDYRYEIGSVFKDEKRNITIIDKKIEKDNGNISRKYYKYHCNVCTAELWMEEGNIKRGSNCACCSRSSNKTVIKGINDIATTNPELIKYFVNIEDAYTHTYSSNKKVLLKCPDCGFKKEMIIANLYKQGFGCIICGDGISYPEKVMGNILKELKVDFKTQLSKSTFKWCKNYRYDFYFEYNNEKYIVETHGNQHYEICSGNWKELKDILQNDKDKCNLAINNEIKKENYIVIDCRKSDLNFVKQNILNSKLKEIFDLNNVDWIKIGKQSEKSLVKEVCDYWKEHNNINNENLSTTYISKIFDKKRVTILRYIKIGDKLGMCDYKKRNTILKTKDNYIEVYKDGIKLREFDTYKDVVEYFNKENFSVSKISKACKTHKLYKGFEFVIKNKDCEEEVV